MRWPKLLALLAPAALGCGIEDGTAFGAPYVMAATPAPHISEGVLVFHATFSTSCPTESSTFEASRFGEGAGGDAPAVLRSSVVVVASRSEAPCASPLPFPAEVALEVRTPLPAMDIGVGGSLFVACPKDSPYEMMKLEDAGAERAAPAVAEPATRPAGWDEAEDGVWEPPANVSQEGGWAPAGHAAAARMAATPVS